MGLILEVFRDGRRERTTMEPLQPGTKGNAQELAIMAGMVRDSAPQPDLRSFVLREIVPKIPGHKFRSEIESCFRYARDHIVYRKDPVGVEIVADLWSVLYAVDPLQPVGDCKKKSTVLASSLVVLGHVPTFLVLTQQPRDTEFRHVYVGVMQEDGTCLPLDPTPEDAPSGWQADATMRMMYPIFGE